MPNQEELNSIKMLEGRVVIAPDGIRIINNGGEQEKHTEDIQEIITKVPSWIVRWGIGMVFGSLLLIVAISILVPYPNTVKSSLKLRSVGNNVPVLTANAGRVTKVFVIKGMVVKQGQPLIEIESASNQIFLVRSPASGKLGFSTVVQNNILVDAKQEMFKIHPLNEHFYGVMQIPKINIGSINTGQQVLIKPAGATQATALVINGKVDFVADEPVNGQFLIKVVFDESAINKNNIKSWMDFEGQIITKKSNLFLKLFGGVVDVYNSFYLQTL